MIMGKFLYLLLVTLVCMACASAPAGVEHVPPEPVDIEELVLLEQEDEDLHAPIEIDQETYDTTLAEVKLFIEYINELIARRNFAGWRDALSDEYFARISSREHLASASQSPFLRARNITLQTAQDYFLHVVVPSRANARVDEIEFEADGRVRAFFVETMTRGGQTETRRLRLYHLININGTWKITN